MNLNSKIKLGLLIFTLGFLFSFTAKAATLELALEKDIANAKDDVSVLVTINSEGQDVNTAQAVISFPANLLAVTSIDRTSSILSFWLEEPSYDNNKGTIRFVGGSTSGLNGSSLRVMRLAFKVKGSGSGKLSVLDGAITASDGSGSNVYNTAKGLDINIPATSEFQAVKLERATQAATLAKELPGLLGIDIPFYPDQTKWNNRSASFQVKWNISSDTTRAAVALNDKSNFTPTSSDEAMTGSMVFPALADGVWYLHLRTENNIGWSPILHYRIAVDTTPPVPFKITTNSSLKTADPKPVISYSSSDLTSGIDFYTIRLDNTVATTTTQTSYSFSPLLPGVHQLTVTATDKAGNSISQTEKLEILPIVSPTITSVSQRVIVNEGQIVALGTASTEVNVLVQVQNSKKQIVFEKTVPVDSNGNWSITINESLNSGNYNLLATAQDKNMASSFPAVSGVIKVAPHPVLSLGAFEINQTWFFIDLVVILLLSFGAGWLTYYKWRKQLSNRVVIAQRDVANILDNQKKDLDTLIKNYSDKELSESDLAEMDYLLKQMRDNLEKSRRFVIDNIEEIGD